MTELKDMTVKQLYDILDGFSQMSQHEQNNFLWTLEIMVKADIKKSTSKEYLTPGEMEARNRDRA